MDFKTDMNIVDSSAILGATNEDQNGSNRHDEHDTRLAPIIITPGITADMVVEIDATHYNMNHKKRGMAVIFNHKTFDDKDLLVRIGTDKDRDDLKEVFENKLGFKVSVHEDYTSDQVRKEFKKIASMDHTNHDCIVICILSHGEKGKICAQDDPYDTKLIWPLFKADKCPTLAGKPKIFIIQACQGYMVDDGVTLKRNQTDSETMYDCHHSPEISSYKIPNHADFLIAYCTVPGYLSWRCRIMGSWYIQELVTELRNSGTENDLVTILTIVCNRVAILYESSTEEPHLHMKKQVPCFISMLTRFLKFDKTTTNNEQVE